MYLRGRIKTEINHSPCVTAREVSITKKKTQAIHKGAYGKIGRSEGQADYEVTVTFSTPSDRAEFSQLADEGIDQDTGEGFTFTYYKGAEIYMLTDCGISSDGFSSDQDSKADQSITFVAVECQRVA